jgi:carbohydrate-selective porin OprB
VVSNIEALPATRLYELWAEQKLFDNTVSVRVGQLAADTEFILSQYAAVFVNSTFGFRPSPARTCRMAVRPIRWRPRASGSNTRPTTSSP